MSKKRTAKKFEDREITIIRDSMNYYADGIEYVGGSFKSRVGDLFGTHRLTSVELQKLYLTSWIPAKICTIFAVTGSLKAFDIIYVLTNGGPAHASEVPSTLMVNMIFNRNKYGFGSAIAIFIIFICFFFAILIQKGFKTEE